VKVAPTPTVRSTVTEPPKALTSWLPPHDRSDVKPRVVSASGAIAGAVLRGSPSLVLDRRLPGPRVSC
jgi:hypothetical protein